MKLPFKKREMLLGLAIYICGAAISRLTMRKWHTKHSHQPDDHSGANLTPNG